MVKELNKSSKELQTKEPSRVHENMTVQDVAEADDQVITSAPFLTDEFILEEVSTMEEEDEINNLANDGDDVDEEVKAPSAREVEHSLETLKNYSLFSKNRGRQMMDIIFSFENLVIVEMSEKYLNSLRLMISSVKLEKTFRYCNYAPYFPFFYTRKICIDTCLQGFK